MQQNAVQAGLRSTHEEQDGPTASKPLPFGASNWRRRTPGQASAAVHTSVCPYVCPDWKASNLVADCHVAGQYPAIDRLLARKQAINKLHGPRGSVTTSPRHNAEVNSLQTKALSQRPDLPASSSPSSGFQLRTAQQLFSQQRSTTDMPSVLPDISGSAQPASRQLGASRSASVSDFAQGQYLCFKAWRQQRHAAAVLIQKHARGLLARRFCVQLRCLDRHRSLIQHRMLSNCIHWWRDFASMQSRFR